MDDYEYERKQRREREKSERQQVQTSSSNREVALFSEPRRVNPSEADDDISAKLGEYSTVKDFINLYTVGISNSGHRQMPPNAILPGIVPVPTSPSVPVIGASSSLLSSVTSSSQRLLPPPSQQSAQSQQSQQQPPHHYQQHQQQLRQAPYVKQADNKPPYNGRGGYPGQPVNRSSSGMAPPKGPPVGGSVSASSASGSLLPPSTTHMPNGRQTSASANEKSYLGPPVAASSLTTQQHNGRFSQPSIPKQRQKPFPQDESDITEILNRVTSTFRPPKMLTGIDATPHNTLIENYNLSEPNKHKYSFDMSAKMIDKMIEPLLDSPPRNDMPAPRFVPPLLSVPPSATTTQMPSTQSASSLSSSVSASSLSIPSSSSAATSSMSSTSQSSLTSSSRNTYIAPLQPAAINATIASSSIANNNSSNATTASTSSGQSSSSTLSTAITSSPTVPLSPLMGRPTKDAGFLKPMKSEKPTPPPLERQNSTLENDLELSESDDDRVKQSCSAVNTSDSSPSDSSESGSESSKSGSNQPALNPAHLHLQQQQMAAVMASKKKLGTGMVTGGSTSSSGLGSSAPPSGGSSSSSSNKTPSPSNTTKWQLSRYFNKAPVHQTPTQDVSPSAASAVVNSVNSMNSMNVANINMPITLRGGAQIIPEPPQQLTSIKNESLLDDQDDNDDEDDDDQRDEDNDKTNSGEKKSNLRRSSKAKKDGSKSATDTFPHPGLSAASAAFPSRKTPASLSVTPLSPMLTDIKKEAATPHPSLQAGSNQQQLPDFLSMNTNQIKHETMVIAGGHTTVTPYDVLQGFSNLSSDSNSSDDGNRERLPVRGPGGTLQIPGVPAAITALPRSPPIMQKAPIPNTLTMIPIDPLPSSPPSVSTRPLPTVQQQIPQTRPRKPRKKLKQAQSAALAPDTSDEEQDDVSKQQRLVPPITAAVVSGLAIAGGTKKGRGRPRKTTPNQSGNMSSNSSASASAKGPSLTAKKDINKKPPASSITPTKANNKKRMSRQNSSNSLAQDTLSTTQSKQLYTAAANTTTQLTAPLQTLEALFTAATSDDSSSSSESSSYSNSKSSTTSDTEIEGPNHKNNNNNKPPLKTITFSSDDDDVAVPSKQKSVQNQKNGEAKTLTTTAPKRIVKKLNTRKSSLEDLSTASSTTKPTNICLSSTSSSESSAEDFSHPSAQASSASLAVQQTANATTNMTGSGSSSQRSVNHQSPYKASGPLSNRSRKPTSCSSAFSSESSGEYHSDSDSGRAKNEKKLKRDKPKSDKNKISTLTRIFKTSNEGGAKKQGQVMIVDQSEDQQQQQQQKHISPALRSSQENLTTLHSALQNATASSQSPRLTPGGHMRSPRSFPMPSHATQGLAAGSRRTPDRSTTSAERKIQQRIKTPTRTPTRTPPTTRTSTPTPAAVAAATVNTPAASRTPTSSSSLQPPLPTSLMCKIDLSRLLHVPAEWHANNYRLHGTHNFGYASAGRTPIYDHETILHADLQSCNTQMRLKSTKNIGGTSSKPPRRTGNRTPVGTTSSISAVSERELSHSRESLNELTKENGNSGRLSSRSTDGSTGGGGSTPKDFSSQLVLPPGPPNGYSSAAAMGRDYGSPSGKASGGKMGLTGVKHEQIIKHEPDAEYSNDTKYKSDTSSTADPSLIKQELLILKQDYKPSDLANITEKSSALCSPNDMQLDAKPRRKRSTSSSSSPFKEKRRKKEKEMVPPPMVTIEKDKMGGGGGYLTGGAKDKDVVMDILKPSKDIMDDKVVHSNGQTQDHHMLVDQQYAPTNHDRLLPEKQQQQQQQQQIDKSYNNNNNSNNTNNNSSSNVSNTASPAHLQTNSSSNVTAGSDMILTTTKELSNVTMPPPSNVGLLTTLTSPASACTKSPHTTVLAQNINNTSSNNSMYNNNNNSNTTTSFTASTETLSVSSSATASSVNNAITTTTSASQQPIQQQQQPPPSQPPPPQVIYRSYFERDDDALNDEFSKDAKFLQEAIHRKHAADREQNTFNQVALYLEAVVYFLLTGAAMEQHSRSEDAAWTMYKDTLSLIKYISSNFRHLQMSSVNQHETHNKVAILSLRCQSLISLKLYKLKRVFCRQINATCTEFFKSGKGDIINGNTPSSISPSNSVGSQGSGSNTPPGKIVPQDIHSALHQQNQFFNYLSSSHELWDQADRLVRQGNYTDFFIALDHENGPLTLHSNVYEVFRYVQAGLKKLKDEMLIQ